MRSTEEAVKSSSIPSIYEATFAYDDVLIRADILERAGDGAWNLIEVKSGASEKIESLRDKHLYDVAVQHYVLSGMGFEIRQAGILDLNKKYVYEGDELDLEGLLKFTDLKEDAVEVREEVPTRIAELKDILKDRTPPSIDPSRHCSKPYACKKGTSIKI
ncbi:hypothetical protein GTO10_00815 [Candidatus Saccharibacteria bacterium]|nr:hypothetical protein [candidate division Zixibacteria bacterium]NIT03470.1 hypothetical protein [Candidatus Saccharibacteria bacterium]